MDKMISKAKQLKIGFNKKLDFDIGPMITNKSKERVLG